jgi:hypothetical protein
MCVGDKMTTELEELTNTIEMNLSFRKKMKMYSYILLGLGAIIILLSAVVPMNSELQKNILQSSLLPVLFGVMIYASYYEYDKIAVSKSLKVIYYLYKTSNQIEELQKKKGDTKKDKKVKIKLKKDIGKNLIKLTRVLSNIELYSKRDKYREKTLSDINFFKKIIYKLNSALINDKPIDNNIISSIKEYCNKRLISFQNYNKENIILNEQKLNEINLLLPEEEEKKLMGKLYFLKIKLIDIPPNLIKIFLLLISFIIEVCLFAIIIPRYVSVDANNQIYYTLIAYGVTVAIILDLFKGKGK